MFDMTFLVEYLDQIKLLPAYKSCKTFNRYQERELERRKQVDYKLFAMQKMKYRVMDVMKVKVKEIIYVLYCHFQIKMEW